MAGQVPIIVPAIVGEPKASIVPGRVVADKNPWQSQTELAALVGALASLLSVFGVVDLTAAQVAGIAAFLFALVGVARMTGDGAKLVFKKSKVAQDVASGQMFTAEDLKTDVQVAQELLNKAAQAATVAGLSGEQLQKFMAEMQKQN